MQIDARGKSCPIPVIMAKKETDQENPRFTILVDNPTAVENLKRFAQSSGYALLLSEQGSYFELEFVRSGDDSESRDPNWDFSIEAIREDYPKNSRNSWAIFVAKEGIGEGDPELSSTLLKMFFYTITQDKNIPEYILFMNAGVKIPVENEQVIEHLNELQSKGTKILVCGACLSFYDLAEKLQAGMVSNMYDIIEAMKEVNKVITL